MSFMSCGKRMVNRFVSPSPILLCRLLLGGIFILAGIGKLPHEQTFIALVTGYGILPDGLATIYASFLPWAEIIIGIMLVTGIATRLFSGISLMVISSFMIANIHALIFGTAADLCGCFGDIMPLTHVQSLTANIAMTGISLYLLFQPCGTSFRRFFTCVSMVARPAGAVLLIGMTLIVSLPSSVYASATPTAETKSGSDSGSYSIDVVPPTVDTWLQDGVEPTLMYFYNEDCANCQEQQPIIDNLEAEYGSRFNLLRIDSSVNRDILETYNITRVPTMLVVTGDQLTDVREKFIGVTGADTLIASLEDARLSLTLLPQDDGKDLFLAAREKVSSPPESESSGFSRIAGDEPTGTEIANLVAPYGQSLDLGGTSTFGPNEAINISVGNILTVNSCADGYNDPFYPSAD
ncbi:MAG: DoxX family membrane protein, partial [Dehalococcoidales bacterium]|nr:DoxX family membrane protein [Dehalococcoidales bacterium]